MHSALNFVTFITVCYSAVC